MLLIPAVERLAHLYFFTKMFSVFCFLCHVFLLIWAFESVINMCVVFTRQQVAVWHKYTAERRSGVTDTHQSAGAHPRFQEVNVETRGCRGSAIDPAAQVKNHHVPDGPDVCVQVRASPGRCSLCSTFKWPSLLINELWTAQVDTLKWPSRFVHQYKAVSWFPALTCCDWLCVCSRGICYPAV